MTFNIKYLGKENKDLNKYVNETIETRLEKNIYNVDEISSIKKLGIDLLKNNINISDTDLENLRSLCKLYDNKLQVQGISSHRKFIGPFIVIAKKSIVRILQFAFRGYINQQKRFNAIMIKNIIAMYNRK